VQVGTKKWCQCVTRDSPAASGQLQRLYVRGEIALCAHTTVCVYCVFMVIHTYTTNIG